MSDIARPASTTLDAVSDFSYWVYRPTKGVSAVFAVLFFISGIWHVYTNIFKYKSGWRLCFLFPWAAALFVAGFSLREYAAESHWHDLGVYIASIVLLFIAPPVYNGANYFILGRLLYYIPYHSIIHPGRVWTTFVALDLVVGIISGNGASRAANANNSPSQIHSGIWEVRASLLLQIAMFLGFVAIILHFHLRIRRHNLLNNNSRTIIYLLYASSLLILLRNTFRTASFWYPVTSVANSSEALFYCLEALPMLFNTYMMNIFPPAKYLPRDYKVYLAVDGKTEIVGPGMVDKRHFLLTIVDPFDIVGLVMGRDKKDRFWERDGIGGPTTEGEVVGDVHGSEGVVPKEP